MSVNKTPKLTVPISDFNPAEDLTFTDFEENDRSRGQLISYPRYVHPKLQKETALLLQLDWTKLDQYGIPRNNPDFYEDDKARSFIKYPIHQEGQENTRTKLESLDEILSSDEFKKAHFGKNWKKYRYISIVRVPDNDDPEKDWPPYIKLKLELSYPEGHIDTHMYRSEMVNGKRVRTPYLSDSNSVSLDQANDLISYLSSVRPIARLVKLWASKKREYGAVFKIPKIEVEPSERKDNLISSWYKTDGFLDSESEEDELHANTNVDEDVDVDVDEDVEEEEENDLDSDSDSDSESEDEVEVVVQKQPVKKKRRGRKPKNTTV